MLLKRSYLIVPTQKDVCSIGSKVYRCLDSAWIYLSFLSNESPSCSFPLPLHPSLSLPPSLPGYPSLSLTRAHLPHYARHWERGLLTKLIGVIESIEISHLRPQYLDSIQECHVYRHTTLRMWCQYGSR